MELPAKGWKRGIPMLSLRATLGVAGVRPKRTPISGVTLKPGHSAELGVDDRADHMLLLGPRRRIRQVFDPTVRFDPEG